MFAVVTAVMLATHKLGPNRNPRHALDTWAVFAAVNLISTLRLNPAAVARVRVTWVTYGFRLPPSSWDSFYVMLRLNPDAARADDEAELQERFTRIKHNARLEVMASPQMKAVIRQMTWQQLPPVVGRQMNLTEGQIAALTRQAPQLLDLNGNGTPDIAESGAAQSGDMDLEDR